MVNGLCKAAYRNKIAHFDAFYGRIFFIYVKKGYVLLVPTALAKADCAYKFIYNCAARNVGERVA